MSNLATYKYSAISKNGKKVSGFVDAQDTLSATEKIKQSCDILLNIQQVKEKKESILNKDIGGKLNNKEFTLMCSQFAIILKAGIPVIRATQLIADKTNDKPLKKILTSVAKDVEGGRSLSRAFSEYGEKLLPVNFIETIRAGEESGNIDSAFENMYRHYSKQNKIAGKVKSAMAYPMFVMVVAIVVVIVLMVKVVPTFISIFDSVDAELPLMTKILINTSNFFAEHIAVIISVLSAVTIGFIMWKRTEKGKLDWAKAERKLPILGEVSVLNSRSQFANNMSSLLRAGLPVTNAVTTTARVISNAFVSKEIGKSVQKLEQGLSLTDSLYTSHCLPDILIDMVQVGEESGELEKTLSTIGEYYDTELEQAVQDAVGKLEPAILMFVAAFAGFIVIAVYFAMFDMYGTM